MLGNLTTTTDGDYYAVTLAAGDTVGVAVEGLTSNFLVFELRDSSGFVLASSIPTGTNADQVLNNFLVTIGGTYYVLVGGNPGDYSLVVNAQRRLRHREQRLLRRGPVRRQRAGGARLPGGRRGAGPGVVVHDERPGHRDRAGPRSRHGQPVHVRPEAGQISEFTPTGVEVLPRINRPGASTDSFDLDFFGEAVNLGGTAVPAGSLLVVNGIDSPNRVYA